ncbi:cupin domain-containing protein [Litchfieldia alkalitelluris]|uniref:cupin domain-containing protein n=1 Tax=Litchfieldia alkalitelluris TaxID=304268 RepID=UPI0009982DF0|nr:cupin domain-containing protein [Litchfieldia alkalitelluris]
MKIYNFSKEVGNGITMYDSQFVMSRILVTEKPARIGCMYLEENGVIGYHLATVPQLLLIVSGEGWVTGAEGETVRVTAGEAVFWGAGEGHETTTETGLTAIVIESEDLNPSLLMSEREE